MEKNVKISLLLDVYGEMLTDKQRDVVDLYYNEDMSLAEIAQHVGISRQGVRDFIVRAQGVMNELEDNLHFLEKSAQSRLIHEGIEVKIKFIEEYNDSYVYSPQIRSALQELKAQIETLRQVGY